MNRIFVWATLILGFCLATVTQAQPLVLDKMDNANNFYMYQANQKGLTLGHQMPGYIVLTRSKGDENFIRWSRPDKRPVPLDLYDTLQIDFPDFGSDTQVQILIEFFKDGHGGKDISGVKRLVEAFNTREKKTLSWNLTEFAKANGVTGEYNGFRLMFRHRGKVGESNSIKIDEIRILNSAIASAAKGYVPKMDPPKPFMFGVGSHMGKQFKGRTPWQVAQTAKDAGFSYVRDEVLWREVEKKKGKLEIPEFANRMIDLYEAQGIKPLLILLYGNKLYDKNLGHPKEGEALEGYIRYAEFVVRHFKGRVKYYEIWNEWDQGLGYPRQKNGKRPKGDPVDYANFVKAVYPRLKAIDPDAVFLAGGHCALSLRWSDWFDRALAEGLHNHCDGLSMHTYTRPYDNPEYWHQWVTELQIRYSSRFNDGNPLPFYITETAWYTKDDAGVDIYVKAQYLARMYLLAKTRPFIRGIWYFNLTGMSQFEIAKLYMPMPAMHAAADVKEIVEQGEYLDRIDAGDPSIWILRFKMPDGSIKTALWSTTPFSSEQTKWTTHNVGWRMLDIKYTGKFDDQPTPLQIKQIGGMQVTRPWGKRLKNNSNDFDFSIMDLPLGPMPIIVDDDFSNIKIQGVFVTKNKKRQPTMEPH